MKRILVTAVLALTAFAVPAPIVGATDSADPVVETPVEPERPDAECTISGTESADTIYGTREGDVICGLGGDDTIYSYGGDDIIYGGEGDDRIFGGSGSDELDGDDGSDRLVGGVGSDTLDAGTGDDAANGGPGDDTIDLGDGDDRSVGGAGSDSIDGGEGTDSLNGGRGVDYCNFESGEISLSCYYDSSLPEITSITIAENTVNTGASDQFVAVDLGVSDTGSGISWLSLNFADENYAVNLSGFGGWWQQCDPAATDSTQPEYWYQYNGCVVSGDANEGVVRVNVRVPQYTRAGTFDLRYAFLSDAAGNYSWMDGTQLEAAGLAASIIQEDEGDASTPEITSVNLLTPTINTSESNQVVELEVGVSDIGSGVSWISVNFADENYLVNLHGWGSAWMSCDDVWALTYSYGCLSSGTANEGVYTIKVIVPRQTRAGTYLLQGVYLADLANNYRYYSRSELDGAGLGASFVQEDEGDAFAPELVSITVDPTEVDTGYESQRVTARAQVADIGSGVSWMSLYFVNSETGTWAYGWSSGSEACSEENRNWIYFGCLESGTNLDGVYAMNVEIPAHAPEGTYALQGAWIADAAGNYSWLWADQLAERGITASFVNAQQ
jgi:hypothetical protein